MNKIFYFLIFFVIIPFVYPISFEEFAETYNYDFDASFLNITSINVQECLDPCNNITIDLMTYSSVPGDYRFAAMLGDKTDVVDTYIFGMNDLVSFTFFPSFPKDNLTFSITAYHDEVIVFHDDLMDINVSGMNITVPQISVIDEYFDEKMIYLNISSHGLNGKYDIKGYMQCNDTTYVSLTKVVFADYDENLILGFDVDRDCVYILTSIEIGDYEFRMDYATNYYNLSSIRFIDDYVNEGDLFVIIQSDKIGKFYLFDEYSKYITKGLYKDGEVIFNGADINSSGLNGPYHVIANIDNTQYDYYTKYYSYDEFSNVDKDKIDEITIKKRTTSAASDAIGFVIDFFKKDRETKEDHNYTLKKKIISNVAKNITDDTNTFSVQQNKTKNNLNIISGNAIATNNFSISRKTMLSLVSIISILMISLFYIRKKAKDNLIIYK